VTEAITEDRSDRPFQSVDTAALKLFFETALSGAATERAVGKSTRVKTYTTAHTVLFETLDLQAGGAWIHKSFINKAKEAIMVPLDRESSQRLQQSYPR